MWCKWLTHSTNKEGSPSCWCCTPFMILRKVSNLIWRFNLLQKLIGVHYLFHVLIPVGFKIDFVPFPGLWKDVRVTMSSLEEILHEVAQNSWTSCNCILGRGSKVTILYFLSWQPYAFFFLHVSVLLVCCSALRLSCHMCENLSVMRYTYIHIVENTTLCSRVENHVYISVFFYDITYEIYLKVIFIDVFIFLLSSDKMLCFYWATYVFFFFSALVLKVQFFFISSWYISVYQCFNFLLYKKHNKNKNTEIWEWRPVHIFCCKYDMEWTALRHCQLRHSWNSKIVSV